MRTGGWTLVFRSKFHTPSFYFSSIEPKVRMRANGNNRGVFDISLIASIASHMSYWADEDVSHFMISQLLSRQRVIRR